MKSEEYLFARLEGFSVDVEKLKAHFLHSVKSFEPILYKDNNVKYFGWAVTSRDGSMEDGVRRISTKVKSPRGITPTPICTGYLGEVMERLDDLGIAPYRARLMQMDAEGEAMPFHVDATKETWRLHIPVITNPASLFEWQREDGTVESVHLPADGSAWLVRVDVNHRAVNRSTGNSSRVHLLMGCGTKLADGLLTEPAIRL